MNMERKTGLMNKKYVSPCFLPGMRLGNIMFTLAAACAHARTVGVECRVPWAYNDASLMLRSRLGDLPAHRTSACSVERAWVDLAA